jgi:hypothetical protein
VSGRCSWYFLWKSDQAKCEPLTRFHLFSPISTLKYIEQTTSCDPLTTILQTESTFNSLGCAIVCALRNRFAGLLSVHFHFSDITLCKWGTPFKLLSRSPLSYPSVTHLNIAFLCLSIREREDFVSVSHVTWSVTPSISVLPIRASAAQAIMYWQNGLCSLIPLVHKRCFDNVRFRVYLRVHRGSRQRAAKTHPC